MNSARENKSDSLFSLISLFKQRIDPGFMRFVRRAADYNLIQYDPVLTRLEAHRERAFQAVRERFLPQLAELHSQVERRDAEAIAKFDALLADALAAMRAERPNGGVRRGFFDPLPLLSVVDRFLYRDDPEWLDDPSFPEEKRTKLLDRLDALNDALGSYDAFVRRLRPLIEQANQRGTKTVRIHDLASGHAGFALRIKQEFGADVIVEASDIKPEYLDIGRKRAKELGLNLEFYVEDALCMDGVKERGVDIITCTQSIHHFPAGMVSRMMGEASRAARSAVIFIDGERSLLGLSMFVPAGLFVGRDLALLRDGIVSLRRMYYKEELALLAALAPGVPPSAKVSTESMGPAHGILLMTHG